jgi:hypothetical protein
MIIYILHLIRKGKFVPCVCTCRYPSIQLLTIFVKLGINVKREEMALDWTYFEKNRGWHWTRIHRVHGDEAVQEKPERQ